MEIALLVFAAWATHTLSQDNARMSVRTANTTYVSILGDPGMRWAKKAQSDNSKSKSNNNGSCPTGPRFADNNTG